MVNQSKAHRFVLDTIKKLDPHLLRPCLYIDIGVIYKTQENKYVPTSLRLRNAISEESHIHTVEKTDRIFKTPDEYRVYRQKKKKIEANSRKCN